MATTEVRCAGCGGRIEERNFMRVLGQWVHKRPCWKLWKLNGYPMRQGRVDWSAVFRRGTL